MHLVKLQLKRRRSPQVASLERAANRLGPQPLSRRWAASVVIGAALNVIFAEIGPHLHLNQG